jgi:hypothetical protein
LVEFANRKVAGSSPDEVIAFFYLPDAASRTMALGLTQSLTEINTRNLPGGGKVARPALKADDLVDICELIFNKMWDPRRLISLWAFMACYRDSFA